MQTIVDAVLRREVTEFSLRFTCERCVHFAPERPGCGNGYPIEEHYRVHLEVVREVAFCKEFELY